jgi:hypothetical protein
MVHRYGTNRSRAEPVRVLIFLRDLLAKFVELAWETVSIYGGLRPIETPTIDQSINIHLVLYIFAL